METIEVPQVRSNTELNQLLEEWIVVDWKANPSEVASEFNKKLKPFGLKVATGNNGDDQFYFKIVKV